MKTNRTIKEIENKIKELVKDSDNFTSDNYGSEAGDNGYYEIYFSETASELTLIEFTNWLFKK